MNWFLRASQWARRPPSWQKVKWLIVIVIACLALFAFERTFGWPDWLTVNSRQKIR